MAKKVKLVKKLEKRLQQASQEYYNTGSSNMTDGEFDQASRELKERSPDSPVLQQVGAPEDGLRKVHHSIPMGSLENSMSVEEACKWWENTRTGDELVASYKVDGASLSLEYEKGTLIGATTRGDGKVGADVFFSIQHVPDIQVLEDENFSGFVRGECHLTQDNFEQINKKKVASGEEPFKNARNAASGIMRNESTDFAVYLSFSAFQLATGDSNNSELSMFHRLESLGFTTPVIDTISTPKELRSVYDNVISERDSIGYGIDGIVLTLMDKSNHIKLGGTDKYPKWSRALKLPAQEVVTRLKGVSISLGHTGALIPTGNLEPVEIDGTTVSNALLCNIEEIERLGVKIGHSVVVCKRGDIIPKIEEVSTTVPHSKFLKNITFPTECPYCDTPTERIGVHICCVNPECDERKVRKLISFVSKGKMDVMHLGDKAVRKIYDAGIKTVKGLLSPACSETFLVHHLGENGYKIARSLEKIVRKPAYDFVGSLGIPDFGSRRVKDLIEKLKLSSAEDLLNVEAKSIQQLPGYQITLARKIAKGIEDASEEILSIPSECAWHIATAKGDKGSVVFTGKVSIEIDGVRATRKMLESLAKENGYEPASAVTSNTKFLVQADPSSQSSKSKKAEKLGVSVISDVQFLNSIGVSV